MKVKQPSLCVSVGVGGRCFVFSTKERTRERSVKVAFLIWPDGFELFRVAAAAFAVEMSSANINGVCMERAVISNRHARDSASHLLFIQNARSQPRPSNAASPHERLSPADDRGSRQCAPRHTTGAAIGR